MSGCFTEKETETQKGNGITRVRRLGLDSAPSARPASRSPWRAHAHLVPGGPGSDVWAGPPGDPARDSEARLGILGAGPGSAAQLPEQEERSGLSL